MKLKKRLPALFLALFLALSPLMLVVPANASSDVLDGVSGSEPGYYGIAGSSFPWPLAFYDGTEISQTGRYIFVFQVVTGSSLVAFDQAPVSVTFSDNMIHIDFGTVYSGVLCSRTGSLSWGSFSPISNSDSSFVFSRSIVYNPISPSSSPMRFFTINVSDYLVSSDAFPFYFPLSVVTSSGGPGVLSVFSGVSSWLVGALNNMITMFYSIDSGFTVLGVLAVASLSLAFILLLIFLIAGWLKFK